MLVSKAGSGLEEEKRLWGGSGEDSSWFDAGKVVMPAPELMAVRVAWVW